MTDLLSDFVTSRLTRCDVSLLRRRKHKGFNWSDNGELKIFVKSRNSLRRGSIHEGLAVRRTDKIYCARVAWVVTWVPQGPSSDDAYVSCHHSQHSATLVTSSVGYHDRSLSNYPA